MRTALATSERQLMHRYKKDFRWRVMPSGKAVAEECFDRGFGNKAKALGYQKLVQTLFPDDVCDLCDTERYFDALGHIYQSKE